jgi:heme/copper-type cytochrome/quinol oxidase subunit 2
MSRNDVPKSIGRWLSAAAAALLIAAAGCCPATTPGDIAVEASGRDAPAPPGPYHIEITGSSKRWQVRYPDFSGRLPPGHDHALSVRNIHVPLNTRVVVVLRSTDYVYTFAVPEHGLEIAVPNLEFQMEFYSDKAGEFDLFGEPLCGDPHSQISGHIVVDPHDRFSAWLDRRL